MFLIKQKKLEKKSRFYCLEILIREDPILPIIFLNTVILN